MYAKLCTSRFKNGLQLKDPKALCKHCGVNIDVLFHNSHKLRTSLHTPCGQATFLAAPQGVWPELHCQAWRVTGKTSFEILAASWYSPDKNFLHIFTTH